MRNYEGKPSQIAHSIAMYCSAKSVGEFEVFTWTALYRNLFGNMTASEPLQQHAVSRPLVAMGNASNETM
jgi:hypothetical protein